MGRYNFSPDELQRRASLSAELKKKSLESRAKSAEAAGPAKKAGEDKKQTATEKPKIDFAALRTQARDRRNFLAGTAAFAGAMAVTAAGTQRFMFPRVLFEPPSTFVAGRVDDYLPNQPIFFKDFRTWIIRTPDRIYALSGRCTHLGCTPAWLGADQKFKCPCHGSGFRMSGLNFEGPAPRALERFKISLLGDQLQVDNARMFLLEKGEWENPESYVLV
jgi:cytochrome b6-f complex iron-sulfur subunit